MCPMFWALFLRFSSGFMFYIKGLGLQIAGSAAAADRHHEPSHRQRRARDFGICGHRAVSHALHRLVAAPARLAAARVPVRALVLASLLFTFSLSKTILTVRDCVSGFLSVCYKQPAASPVRVSAWSPCAYVCIPAIDYEFFILLPLNLYCYGILIACEMKTLS